VTPWKNKNQKLGGELMTKLRLLALLTVVLLAVALLPALVSAQPLPPCRIHGTAMVDGVSVADGTVITATIDGDTYTSKPTPSAYGASTYLVEIAQPEGKSYAGKTVTFMIGSDTASQTATWTQGDNITLDLMKGAPPVTPPAGGGISSVNAVDLPAGSEATASYDPATGKLTLGIPAGAKGDTGDTGPAGAAGPAGSPGEDGDDASAALGIVALIIAIVALIGAALVLYLFMKRKTA